MVNVNQLKGRMVMNGYTQKEISSLLGISERTFSNKINNKTPFNTCEVSRLCQLLLITDPQEKLKIFFDELSQK